MATGVEIREALARPPWKICLLLGKSTANAGGEGQITDTTRLQSTALPSTVYDGCYVRLTSEDAGDPNDYAADGSQSMVDYVDTANGILHVSPNFITGAVDGTQRSGHTYEIWRPGVNPDDVDQARDEALTEVCSSWAIQVVSELTNADYEDAIGTTWSNVAGGAGTVAIQALTFPYEYTRNSLLVTNGLASGYSASDSVYVQPGRDFYIYAPCSVQSGTAQVVVRDITNGANIALNGTATSTLRGWTAIEVTGSVPSGCEEIQVYLRGQESGAVVEWGPVNFYREGQRRIALPARVVSRKHVGPIFVGTNYMEAGSGVYWGEGDLERITDVRVFQANDNVMLRFKTPLGNAPYYFTERINYDALSTAYVVDTDRVVGDDATTTCPLGYVVAATTRLLAEQYIGGDDPEYWNGILQQAVRRMERMEREFGPDTKPRQERSRTVGVTQLPV